MRTLRSDIEKYEKASEEQKVASALMVGFFWGFLLPWTLGLGSLFGARTSFAIFSVVATTHYAYGKLTYGFSRRKKA
jgi:hypothetical protein